MYPHQGPVLSVCWNKVRFGRSVSFHAKSLIRIAAFTRMEPRFSLVALTTQGECSTYRQVNPNKSLNMKLPSRLLSGLRHHRVEF